MLSVTPTATQGMTYSGMMIVNAAPTSSPMPKTDTAFSVLPRVPSQLLTNGR